MFQLLHAEIPGFFQGFQNWPFLLGLFMSIFHVISGPDHLAAVAPLAIDTRSKSWKIGLAWGLGHVGGMLIIGVLLLYFKSLVPVDAISTYSEELVGILLLLIGGWAIYRVLVVPKAHKHSHPHTHTTNKGESLTHIHHHQHPAANRHVHTHAKPIKQSFWAALGIGILHGLAGVSHMVHLLPSLAFPEVSQSVRYLVGFGMGTIIAMVAFSYLLGFIGLKSSLRPNKGRLQMIQIASGVLAILVGIVWLI